MKKLFVFIFCGLLIVTGCKKDKPLLESGTIGELTWTLSSDGTLTISGIGKIPSYYTDSPSWTKELIHAVVINDGVTSIGYKAFYECHWLWTVTIGNSVTTIEYDAFGGCNGLWAINVDNSNAVYSSENGVLFNKAKTKLIQCPVGKTGEFTIPNSMTNIESFTFANTKLTSIIIPNSVTDIGIYAFYSCEFLTSVTIPNSVTSIGKQAFVECRSLVSVTIPNSVTAIGDQAFFGCFDLMSIYVDNGNTAYCSEDGVLFNKTKDTLVAYPEGKTGAYTIPNSVIAIGYGAFWGCTGLTSVTIPNSVTSIENYAFSQCSGLTEVINESAIPQDIESAGITRSVISPYLYVFFEVDISACTLRVPAASVSAYRTAPVWKDFGNIVAIN